MYEQNNSQQTFIKKVNLKNSLLFILLALLLIGGGIGLYFIIPSLNTIIIGGVSILIGIGLMIFTLKPSYKIYQFLQEGLYYQYGRSRFNTKRILIPYQSIRKIYIYRYTSDFVEIYDTMYNEFETSEIVRGLVKVLGKYISIVYSVNGREEILKLSTSDLQDKQVFENYFLNMIFSYNIPCFYVEKLNFFKQDDIYGQNDLFINNIKQFFLEEYTVIEREVIYEDEFFIFDDF